MNKKVLLSFAVLSLVIVMPVIAAENFVPGNRDGGAPAAEEKSRVPASQKKSDKDNFWAKEYERSGIKQTTEGNWATVVKVVNVPGWLKREEEQYLARKGGTSMKAAAPSRPTVTATVTPTATAVETPVTGTVVTPKVDEADQYIK